MYIRFFLISLFVLFIFSDVHANNNFFKCLEKISEVRLDQNSLYEKGTNYGTSYIKLTKNNNSIQNITIHFKLKNSENKLIEIVKKKKVNNSLLGFDLKHSYSVDKSTFDVEYNFIEIDETYAFTKKNFSWSSPKNKYDFDTSSRCKKIKKNKYLSLLDINYTKKNVITSYSWTAISKHPKSSKDFIATKLSTKEKAINLAMKKCYEFVSKDLNKIGYNDCYLFKSSDNKFLKVSKFEQEKLDDNNNRITGTRTFALSWEGVDELIIGKLSFKEEDLLGRLTFTLPNNDIKCSGSYALSTTKGTWSILCEKNEMNASGFLKWNNQNGSVSGSGEDSNGKKVKFKVVGTN